MAADRREYLVDPQLWSESFESWHSEIRYLKDVHRAVLQRAPLAMN